MTTYPYGYGTGVKTMEQLRDRYEPKMHPEFARRLFGWLESMGGHIGIGGGWRDIQPDKPGSAPDGKSFHQSQRWASGLEAYAAVDLVTRNGANIHRAPTWDESETAPAWGLHTFIQFEPWHMQPIETRGWQSWVRAGRLDPEPFTLPSDPVPEPEEPPMRLFKFDESRPPLYASGDGVTAFWVSGPQFKRWRELSLIDPANIEILDKAEAVRYTFVGGQPPEADSGIWANSQRA